MSDRLASAEWRTRPEIQAIFAALDGATRRTRAVGGVVRDTIMGRAHSGDIDMATALMTDEGAAALTESLASDPPANSAQWVDRVSAALVENGKPDALELNVDLPGWTEEVVSAMTELYLDDCARIAGLPGVRFLTPPG